MDYQTGKGGCVRGDMKGEEEDGRGHDRQCSVSPP